MRRRVNRMMCRIILWSGGHHSLPASNYLVEYVQIPSRAILFLVSCFVLAPLVFL